MRRVLGILTLVAAVVMPACPRAWAGGDAGFIGMQVQGVSPLIAEAMGRSSPQGVLVRDVALGGPADRAGLLRGDLILSLAGTDIDTFDTLLATVAKLESGRTVTARIVRDGREEEIALAMGSWPATRLVSRNSFVNMPEVGLTLAALTDKVREQFGLRWGTTGVVVTLVDTTRVQLTDLQRGEVIVQVNQKTIADPEQVRAHYAEARKMGRKALLALVEGRGGFRFSLIAVK